MYLFNWNRSPINEHFRFSLIYIVCIYKCSLTFVDLFLNIIIHWWGRGVSKRYLIDITCGMGSKTCQNMISILKYNPLVEVKLTDWNTRDFLSCNLTKCPHDHKFWKLNITILIILEILLNWRNNIFLSSCFWQHVCLVLCCWFDAWRESNEWNFQVTKYRILNQLTTNNREKYAAIVF